MQKLVFISAHSGVSKTNKPYDFIRVSNGITAMYLGNPKKLDFSKYKEGDSVQLEMEVKPHWNGRDVTADVLKVL